MKEEIRLIDLAANVFDSYRMAIRLVTDKDFLAILTEQVVGDERLSRPQVDSLLALLESREGWLGGLEA